MDILTITLSIIAIFFIVAYIGANRRINNLSEAFAKLLLFQAASDQKDPETLKIEEDIHKEDFIKFLSDSRDWAFTYIEQVQSGIKKFVEEVEPQIEYYNTYGIVIEGMVPPHDFALKKISKEFQELKKFLPEETNDRR